jgi:four helix bundle protein
LIAWQKAMQLARLILRMTPYWPPEERFEFTRQVRRAASSIPLNIAEGQGRMGKAELRHHLSIAHGSLCELETQLELAPDYGVPDDDALREARELAAEVGRILRGFLRSLDQ